MDKNAHSLHFDQHPDPTDRTQGRIYEGPRTPKPCSSSCTLRLPWNAPRQSTLPLLASWFELGIPGGSLLVLTELANVER